MSPRAWLVPSVLAVALAGTAVFMETRPATAQGGIVCAYGPASYRRCCSQSYARKPGLGASARAHDIDACTSGGGKSAKKASRG